MVSSMDTAPARRAPDFTRGPSHHHSKLWRFCRLAFPALALALAAAAPPAPTAREILDGVRVRQSQQEIALHGQLRQDGKPGVVPFELVENGPRVRYVFANPAETLQLQIGENESRLELLT